jgi:NAD(P)-dependent dehydrogenase (short-subunit alcohol dehydrogenase family)
MDRQFGGKVALVTGGNSGLGKASALSLAGEGAQVVISARRAEEGEKVTRLIKDAGGEAVFIRADMSVRAEIEALVAQTVEAFGRLDFAINNAGIEGTLFVPTADYSEDTWDEVINVNLKAVWLCMRYEIPHILKQKGGSIVNMSSVAGLVGGPIGAAYHASKHGVIGLTKAAAVEYASQGLRVNAVAPAVIHTAMTERGGFHTPQLEPQLIAMHPMGRFGTPEEVGGAVAWLCSDAASFITGHVLPIDGGFLAR